MQDLTSDGVAAETEVGSYFVANYPPFSVWTPQDVATDALPALGHRGLEAQAALRTLLVTTPGLWPRD